MSDLAPLGPSSHSPSISPAQRNGYHATAPTAASSVNRGRDEVELSTQARLLSRLKDTPDIRSELVTSIRSQIADGSYETPQKLDAAVDSLYDDLMSDLY